MERPWKIDILNEYITNLKAYYNNCPTPNFPLSDKAQDLLDEEKKYLNAHISIEKILNTRSTNVLNKLLQQSEKLNFTKHLLASQNFVLEVNTTDGENTTFIYLFNLLLKFSEEYYMSSMFVDLFRRGYKIKVQDEVFLTTAYKKLATNTELGIWSLARFACKLNDYEKIKKAVNNNKILFIIASFKLNKPIGFRYPNLLSIANNALQFHKENGDIIIKAMHHYRRYEDIVSADKKGTFAKKEAYFKLYMPVQDINFLGVIFDIFPELKE